jgi:hypothetical protein
MAGMRVYGRDGSVWQSWECMAEMGVYGRDGSVW